MPHDAIPIMPASRESEWPGREAGRRSHFVHSERKWLVFLSCFWAKAGCQYRDDAVLGLPGRTAEGLLPTGLRGG